MCVPLSSFIIEGQAMSKFPLTHVGGALSAIADAGLGDVVVSYMIG